jgi:nucleotide-binding universal stress UspA family protein
MLPIRKILFPTDFSNASTLALGHAVMLADSFGAELTLFHVAADEKHSRQAQFPQLEKAGDELQELAEAQLAEMAGAKRPQRLAVKRVVRQSHLPAQEIANYARDEGFDLLVMGTHGRTGVAHLLMGSMAENLVRLAPCPVLTVREHTPKAEVTPYLKILAPVDFSPFSEKALKYGIALAMNFEASLAALHVMDQPVQPTHYQLGDNLLMMLQPDLESRTHQALQQMMKRLAPKDMDYSTAYVFGRAYAEIVNYAARNDVDLMVIGTHGLSGLQQFLLGSTAAKIVRHAPCPVLTVKAKEKDFI